jgi:DNA-binding NarL/FixJ family response regulator
MLSDMSAIRTLIVDDQLLFAQALAARLSREADLEVLPIAHDQNHAATLLHAFAPTVLIVDLFGQGSNGLTSNRMNLLDDVAANHPACRPIVLTSVSDADQVVDAVRRGARAWLSKTVDGAHLIRVIRGVARGESWIPPDLLGHVLQRLTADRSAEVSDPMSLLTARERDVLQYAVDGLTRIEIARRLYVSPNTVRTHTQNLLGKLPAHSMLEAVCLARRCGMRPRPI